MPYLRQTYREGYGNDLGVRARYFPGDLNYVITKIVRDYLGNVPTYADFTAAIGVLESAKLELYRRMIAPYEDQKLKENGDVY
jgi:hypothetical protein